MGTDRSNGVVVKQEEPSPSAEGVAALRAVESLRPEDERVCYGPYAKDFLGTKYTILTKSRLLTKIALWNAERKTPGVRGCIVGRTRYVDDCFEACIDDGMEQMVVFGAGYNSPAYRFDEQTEEARVFEVDHLATQELKLEKVKKIFGSLPENVVHVPIDFDKEKLDERLFEGGYGKNLKTLFIWEGVIMYITAQAVDEALALIAKNLGKGSQG